MRSTRKTHKQVLIIDGNNSLFRFFVGKKKNRRIIPFRIRLNRVITFEGAWDRM